MRGWGRTTVEVAIMLGWLLPDIVAAFLWQATTSRHRLHQHADPSAARLPGLQLPRQLRAAVVIIANVWKGTAWSYLLFSAALDSISREILEAARVDGATGLQRVWLVILPIIRPHIATNMLFITIWTFTYFPLIYALTGGGPGSADRGAFDLHVPPVVRRRKTRLRRAISVAMVLIVGVLSVFYLRQLKEPK